ncbi:hypothetical protein B0T16DRAFT_192701 [Cercophora newfieldiana]|uniref:Uncharacterized protein n=1 Tax=Cercophora newfieldiana TaxID=92897 RepID=A0AA39Y140_9PEZI|nr:hypothetical protein B0T16DRAFT_192701 [Cercophora newfieldiana]
MRRGQPLRPGTEGLHLPIKPFFDPVGCLSLLSRTVRAVRCFKPSSFDPCALGYEAPLLVFAGMVQLTPDLASLEGTDMFPRPKEQAGEDSHQRTTQLVQMENSSSITSNARPIPRNFVWRLHGGRSSSSTSLTETLAEGGDGGEMAVDVPALRDSFDPWGQHEKEQDDGRCKGCSKIAKARAAAAVAAAAQHDVPSSPNGKQTPIFYTCINTIPILVFESLSVLSGDDCRFDPASKPPRHRPPLPRPRSRRDPQHAFSTPVKPPVPPWGASFGCVSLPFPPATRIRWHLLAVGGLSSFLLPGPWSGDDREASSLYREWVDLQLGAGLGLGPTQRPCRKSTAQRPAKNGVSQASPVTANSAPKNLGRPPTLFYHWPAMLGAALGELTSLLTLEPPHQKNRPPRRCRTCSPAS